MRFCFCFSIHCDRKEVLVRLSLHLPICGCTHWYICPFVALVAHPTPWILVGMRNSLSVLFLRPSVCPSVCVHQSVSHETQTVFNLILASSSFFGPKKKDSYIFKVYRITLFFMQALNMWKT